MIELTIISKENKQLVKQMEEQFPKMTDNFKKLLEDEYLTFLTKQNDYGPSNISMNTQLRNEDEVRMSLAGVVTRMNDKMSRIINLIIKSKDQPKNEPIEDSFKDISVYAKIARIVKAGNWAK
jgi:HSP90 family molecular chaperone